MHYTGLKIRELKEEHEVNPFGTQVRKHRVHCVVAKQLYTPDDKRPGLHMLAGDMPIFHCGVSPCIMFRLPTVSWRKMLITHLKPPLGCGRLFVFAFYVGQHVGTGDFLSIPSDTETS